MRADQREALLRVLRAHRIDPDAYYCTCAEWPNGGDSPTEHLADALLDAGCVMPDAMTDLEIAAATEGSLTVDEVRAALRAISTGGDK